MEYGPEVYRQHDRHSYRVGSTQVFTFAAVYDSEAGTLAGTGRTLSTASVVGLDIRERETIGTCSSGSSTAIYDSSRTEADDFWVGVKATLRDASTGREYTSRVTASTASTGHLAVDGWPVSATTSDTYVLHGYPLVTYTTANVSQHNATYSVSPSDLMAYEGERELHFLLDFGTAKIWYEHVFEVTG